MKSGVMDGLVHPMLKLGKFIHRLGLVQGTLGFVRVSRNEKLEDGTVRYSVKVPGFPEPVCLRAIDSDGFVFSTVIVDLQYNLPEVSGVRLIVDCGANIGMSALYFSRRYPQAKVIAIEPDPDNFAMLVKNTRQAPQVQPVHAGVWPRRTSLSIADPTRSHASYSVTEGEGKGAGNIPAVVLADIVAEHGPIDILKIDIEGSEKPLFEDPACDEWLKNTRVIYVELHDWMKPGSSGAFYKAITRFDFSQQHMGEVVAIELHHPPAVAS